VLARARQDSSFRHLLDLSVSGIGHALVELLMLCFRLVPAQRTDTPSSA